VGEHQALFDLLHPDAGAELAQRCGEPPEVVGAPPRREVDVVGRFERGTLGDGGKGTDDDVLDPLARALAAKRATLRRWRASAAPRSSGDLRAWRANKTRSWSSRGARRKRSSRPAPARIRWMVGMLGSRLPVSIRAMSDCVTPAR
jgi:hypothetical protein